MLRDNYFSLMKGIAIVAVLFIHTPFMSDGAAGIAARQLFTFAVAMFYFLSGYFVKDEKLDKQGIKRLLIPYVLWSFLWFAETSITGSQPITTWKIINSVLFGGAFFPLYFLIVMIELKLITPWMIRHIQARYEKSEGKKLYSDWALWISPLMLLVLYAIQYSTRQQPLIYAQVFPTWFIFYYVGALLKFGRFEVKAPAALGCTLLGIYLMHWESTYINEVLQVPFWAATQIKFSSYFFALSLCLLSMSIHQQVSRNAIVRLGELSFGIYLLHMPVLKVLGVVENRLVTPPIYEIANVQIIRVVSALLICYLILCVAHKVLPEKINKYLGFK